MSRFKRKQIWADEMFAMRLEQIKAKRLLIGKPVKNMTELTRLILQSDTFDIVERELLDNQVGIKIKFDGWIK